MNEGHEVVLPTATLELSDQQHLKDRNGSMAGERHPHPGRPQLGVKPTKSEKADAGLGPVRDQGSSGRSRAAII